MGSAFDRGTPFFPSTLPSCRFIPFKRGLVRLLAVSSARTESFLPLWKCLSSLDVFVSSPTDFDALSDGDITPPAIPYPFSPFLVCCVPNTLSSRTSVCTSPRLSALSATLNHSSPFSCKKTSPQQFVSFPSRFFHHVSGLLFYPPGFIMGTRPVDLTVARASPLLFFPSFSATAPNSSMARCSLASSLHLLSLKNRCLPSGFSPVLERMVLNSVDCCFRLF